MAVHSRDWIELHDLLKESIGEETAGKLMDFLPPVGWADVATKDDLRALEASLRGEFGKLRGEFGELRGEFGELKADIADMHSGLIKWFAGSVVAALTMSAGIAAAVAAAMS